MLFPRHRSPSLLKRQTHDKHMVGLHSWLSSGSQWSAHQGLPMSGEFPTSMVRPSCSALPHQRLSLAPVSTPNATSDIQAFKISVLDLPPHIAWYLLYDFTTLSSYHRCLHTSCLLALACSPVRSRVYQFLPGPCLHHSAQHQYSFDSETESGLYTWTASHSLCGLRCPQICSNSPASASHTLGLQSRRPLPR